MSAKIREVEVNKHEMKLGMPFEIKKSFNTFPKISTVGTDLMSMQCVYSTHKNLGVQYLKLFSNCDLKV